MLFNQAAPEVIGDGAITPSGDTADVITLNTVSGFGLNPMAGGDSVVMSLPAFSPSQGFHFNTGLSTGNGGGAFINQYTMVFDLYWAESASWFSFFNAEGYNTNNDADFFRRGSDGAIGIGNDGYFGTTQNNQWYRVALTVTNVDATTSNISIYLDGVYLGTSVRAGGTDGRFSLYRSTASTVNQTLLFGDDNGETGPVYVSQFFFDDRVYTASEILAMGGASYAAIPEPATAGLIFGGVIMLAAYRRYARGSGSIPSQFLKVR